MRLTLDCSLGSQFMPGCSSRRQPSAVSSPSVLLHVQRCGLLGNSGHIRYFGPMGSGPRTIGLDSPTTTIRSAARDQRQLYEVEGRGTVPFDHYKEGSRHARRMVRTWWAGVPKVAWRCLAGNWDVTRPDSGMHAWIPTATAANVFANAGTWTRRVVPSHSS